MLHPLGFIFFTFQVLIPAFHPGLMGKVTAFFSWWTGLGPQRTGDVPTDPKKKPVGCPGQEVIGSMVFGSMGEPTYKWDIFGWHNPLILTIDPNFQRDIQAGSLGMKLCLLGPIGKGFHEAVFLDGFLAGVFLGFWK